MSSFSKFSLRRFWRRVINAFNFSENRAIYHSHSVPSLSLFIYYLPIYSSHRCVPTDGWSIISRIEISRWMKKKKKILKISKGRFLLYTTTNQDQPIFFSPSCILDRIFGKILSWNKPLLSAVGSGPRLVHSIESIRRDPLLLGGKNLVARMEGNFDRKGGKSAVVLSRKNNSRRDNSRDNER